MLEPPYPTLATVNATTDATQLLVYVNTISGEWFVPMMQLAFFLVIFIGGAISQMRFSGRTQLQGPFMAGAFALFGMTALLSLKDGLISTNNFVIVIAVNIAAILWLYFSQPEY